MPAKTPSAAQRHDPRVDAYIERAAPFARPLLEQLRRGVHAAHPGITEAIKWGMPHFMYGGRILAGMAAFKAHATFGFWQADQVEGADRGKGAMGQFGRLTDPHDLPGPGALQAMVRQAVGLIDAGAPPRSNRRSAVPKPPPEVPAFLREALAGHPAAQAVFDAFPPGQQREYVDWLNEARQAATRARRLAQALQWLGEGKRRNWKYERG